MQHTRLQQPSRTLRLRRSRRAVTTSVFTTEAKGWSDAPSLFRVRHKRDITRSPIIDPHSLPVAIGFGIIWALVSYWLDHKNATSLSSQSNDYTTWLTKTLKASNIPKEFAAEHVAAVGPKTLIAACIAAIACAILSPAQYSCAASAGAAGLTILAAQDFKSELLWDDLASATLFFVAALQIWSGNGDQALIGLVCTGGIFVVLYLIAIALSKETGRGDVIPAAIVGCAAGPTAGVVCLAAALVVWTSAYFVVRLRTGNSHVPLGPMLAAATVLAVMFHRLVPNITI